VGSHVWYFQVDWPFGVEDIVKEGAIVVVTRKLRLEGSLIF
jgi:hypothetical protein